MKKAKRVASRTVLLVGEGDCDCAFLHHLKGIYIQRGCGVSVTIRNAHGKGAGNVIDTAIGQSRNADYDLRVAVLDTDTDWTPRVRKKAKTHKIILVPSTPCLEGFLLTILGQYLPHGCRECKEKIKDSLDGKLTDAGSYSSSFPFEVLEARRNEVPALDLLLKLFAGKQPNS